MEVEEESMKVNIDMLKYREERLKKEWIVLQWCMRISKGLTNVIRITKREEKGWNRKPVWIMSRNFPNLVKDTYFHIQEYHKTPSRINTQETTPGHIIMICWNPKIKNKKTWKVSKQNDALQVGTMIWMMAGFS